MASSLSAGWARYVLERRYGIHASAVRAGSLGRVRLADFDVVVFPSGDYESVVGEALVERLRGWMRDGGTLVTLAEASRWAADEDVELLGTQTERRGGRAAGDDPPEPDKPALYALCGRRQGSGSRRIIASFREPSDAQRGADALRAAGAEVEIALISAVLDDETIPRAFV